jgi:2-polyprenyl-6-hydroxyphenyl methylase/3-demethylubiquinone-9 3-methyltransferase
MPIDNQWYDELGDAWWDCRGPMAALHDFNEACTAYATGVIRGVRAEIERPRVLDVGAGGGLFSASLAVSGFEWGRCLAALAGRIVPTHEPGDGGAPSYVAGNAMLLPFADGNFDAAVCSEVLEHVPLPGVLVQEVARVLRPGGMFCFDTPNRTWFARLGLISIAENLGWVPRGTHDFRLFLTPAEMRHHLMSATLLPRDL